MTHDGTKLIHRFWAGREIPDEYVIFGQMWSDLNPGWHVVHWNETHVEEFKQLYPAVAPVIEDLYARDGGRFGIELYVQLADIMGYLLVHRFGGVYTNCDMQPVSPIEGRLPYSPWASFENQVDGRIVNAIIGAPEPGDDFWGALIDGLPGRYFLNPSAEMVETTGPAYLTDFVRLWVPEHLLQFFYVFPVETFNPVHWKEVAQGGDALGRWTELVESSPNTIAVHHWGHRKDGRTNRVETATR